MIIGFIMGVLRAHPAWLVVLVAAGAAFDYFLAHGGDGWRIEAGLQPLGASIAVTVAWTAAFDAAAYLVGRAVRWIADRARRPA